MPLQGLKERGPESSPACLWQIQGREFRMTYDTGYLSRFLQPKAQEKAQGWAFLLYTVLLRSITAGYMYTVKPAREPYSESICLLSGPGPKRNLRSGNRFNPRNMPGRPFWWWKIRTERVNLPGVRWSSWDLKYWPAAMPVKPSGCFRIRITRSIWS